MGKSNSHLRLSAMPSVGKSLTTTRLQWRCCLSGKSSNYSLRVLVQVFKTQFRFRYIAIFGIQNRAGSGSLFETECRLGYLKQSMAENKTAIIWPWELRKASLHTPWLYNDMETTLANIGNHCVGARDTHNSVQQVQEQEGTAGNLCSYLSPSGRQSV